MQSINFTMLAPSGAGGAYFTELLDDNWSIEGTQNKDNNRYSKTNRQRLKCILYKRDRRFGQ